VLPRHKGHRAFGKDKGFGTRQTKKVGSNGNEDNEGVYRVGMKTKCYASV